MKIDWIIYREEQNRKGTLSQNLIKNADGRYMNYEFNLELPYESNVRNISCIPSGIYRFDKRIHQSRGRILRILGVKERSDILVHVGNFLKDTEGCILPCTNWRINKDGSEYVGESSGVALSSIYEALPPSGYVHIVSQA